MKFNRQRQAVITNELVDIIVRNCLYRNAEVILRHCFSRTDWCICSISALKGAWERVSLCGKSVEKLERQSLRADFKQSLATYDLLRARLLSFSRKSSPAFA